MRYGFIQNSIARAQRSLRSQQVSFSSRLRVWRRTFARMPESRRPVHGNTRQKKKKKSRGNWTVEPPLFRTIGCCVSGDVFGRDGWRSWLDPERKAEAVWRLVAHCFQACRRHGPFETMQRSACTCGGLRTVGGMRPAGYGRDAGCHASVASLSVSMQSHSGANDWDIRGCPMAGGDSNGRAGGRGSGVSLGEAGGFFRCGLAPNTVDVQQDQPCV